MTTQHVLVVDADPALFPLLQEWLAECDCIAVQGGEHNEDRFDLVIVDIPFPRQGGAESVARLAREHPDARILALSSCFFSGVACRGAVARTLGVASVLPKPVARDALISAVRALIND